MATIDLGKIKIVWKGTYSGGTAYVIDEAVVHSGTSYICIANTTGNAPPNGTYWNVLAQAGTNGTDLTSTLTAQGDVLYRDGSGLAKLAAGTSGQFLKTQGAGANPVWAAAGGGGKILQVVQGTKTDSTLSTSSSFVTTGLDVAITPSASNSKVLVMVSAYVDDNASGVQSYYTIYRGSTDLGNSTGGLTARYVGGARGRGSINMNILDEPNTTSSTTYTVYMRNASSANIQINSEGSKTTIIAMEVGA